MKKATLFIILILISSVIETSYAQYTNTIELGVFNTPANSNILEIRVRPTVTIPIPLDPNEANYSNGVFTLRCANTYGVTAIDIISTSYNYHSGSSCSGISFLDGYTYFNFSMENTYRLKIVEQDNTSKYSKIVSVDFGEGVKGKSFPNPCTTELIVEMDIAQNTSGEVFIELFDMSGKQVFARKVPVAGRKLIYHVPIEDFIVGEYILRVKNGKDSWQQKINKQ